MRMFKFKLAATAALIGLAAASPAAADQVFNDDVIVTSSLCVGFDCTNFISFGFDTIVLKENNLRILFDDTSTAASFPSNDWRLTANGTSNGGAEVFSIDDATAGRAIFLIGAGAPANSLVVDAQGDIAIGRGSAQTTVHMVDGNTPTVRLEQDGSSGFTPQTFDVAANEANFFIRDVTNGSTLPFRIRPSAPTSAIDIAANGRVGILNGSPAAPLDIISTSTTRGTTGSANNASLRIRAQNSGAAMITYDPADDGEYWLTQATANNRFFRISKGGSGGVEFNLQDNGDLTILGTLTTGGPSCSGGCDSVFDEDYELPSIEANAEYMFSNSHLMHVGATAEDGSPFNMTEKMGGMLTQLEYAHIYIAELHEQQEALIARLDALEAQRAQ